MNTDLLSQHNKINASNQHNFVAKSENTKEHWHAVETIDWKHPIGHFLPMNEY